MISVSSPRGWSACTYVGTLRGLRLRLVLQPGSDHTPSRLCERLLDLVYTYFPFSATMTDVESRALYPSEPHASGSSNPARHEPPCESLEAPSRSRFTRTWKSSYERVNLWSFMTKYRYQQCPHVFIARCTNARACSQTSVTLLDSLEGFLSTFQKDLSAVSGQISNLQDRSKDIDNRLKSRRVSPITSLIPDGSFTVSRRKSRNHCPTSLSTYAYHPHLRRSF